MNITLVYVGNKLIVKFSYDSSVVSNMRVVYQILGRGGIDSFYTPKLMKLGVSIILESVDGQSGCL